jgi:hypothetical protein
MKRRTEQDEAFFGVSQSFANTASLNNMASGSSVMANLLHGHNSTKNGLRQKPVRAILIT